MPEIPGSSQRVSSFAVGSPAAADDDAVLQDTAMDSANTTVVSSFDGQPDVARALSVKGNDANVSGNVVIDGTSIGGEVLEETLALDGANVVTGSLAFKTVTEVTLPPYDTADTERVRVGTGSALGLPVKLSRDTVIAVYHNGVRETTRPTVAVSGSVLAANTVDLDTAPNGTPVIVDYYDTP